MRWHTAYSSYVDSINKCPSWKKDELWSATYLPAKWYSWTNVCSAKRNTYLELWLSIKRWFPKTSKVDEMYRCTRNMVPNILKRANDSAKFAWALHAVAWWKTQMFIILLASWCSPVKVPVMTALCHGLLARGRKICRTNNFRAFQGLSAQCSSCHPPPDSAVFCKMQASLTNHMLTALPTVSTVSMWHQSPILITQPLWNPQQKF